MAKNTETTKAAEKPCRCLLGWTGTDGTGSTLEAAKDYTIPCDRLTKNAFAQGHDARMSSRLATEIAQGLTDRDTARKLIELAGGSSLLVSKTMRSADLRSAKAAKASPRKQAADEAARVVAEANPKTASADKDEAEAISRVRSAVRAVVNPEPESGADEEPGDNLPEVGDEVQVKHGKRSYTAIVTDAGDGELIAQHGMFGKMCNHDPFTGEVIETFASEEAPEF